MTHASATTTPSTTPVVCIGATPSMVREALARTSGRIVALVTEPRAAAALLPLLEGPGAVGRVAVLVGPDYTGAAQVAADTPGLSSAPVLIDPALERDRPDDLQRARRAVARLSFQGSANDGARRIAAARYLLHTLTNAPRLAREADVAALGGLLRGIPAVVVAAGPSLDRNISDLRATRDRLVVIACDTAARPLMSVGIDPHFVVASDSSRANAAHLGALPSSRAWLVGEGSLHPSAFPLFDGRTFVFRVSDHEPWPWLRAAGVSAAHLETWGSVATTAVSLARHLGCGPIGLVGADFAFTEGRPYARGTSFEAQWAAWHAAGSPYDDIWRMLRERWASVTSEIGIDGRQVETAPHLLAFRDWINERTSHDPSLRIINATGAGLLAGSAVEQRSLGDVFSGADPIDANLLDQLLTAAHANGRGDLGRLLQSIPTLAADGNTTIEQWMTFAGGSVTVSAITAALRSPEYQAWTLGHQAGRSKPG